MGQKFKWLPILDNWLIDENALIAALNEKTKLVALNFVSNVTGTEQHIQHLIRLIRQHSKCARFKWMLLRLLVIY